MLTYPGGFGTGAHLGDEAQSQWLRDRRADTPLVTSVCTGSLVLGRAGLLAGRTERARAVRRGIQYDPQPPP